MIQWNHSESWLHCCRSPAQCLLMIVSTCPCGSMLFAPLLAWRFQLDVYWAFLFLYSYGKHNSSSYGELYFRGNRQSWLSNLTWIFHPKGPWMKARSQSELWGFFFQVGIAFFFFPLYLVLPLKDLFSFCGSTGFPLRSVYLERQWSWCVSKSWIYHFPIKPLGVC